MYLRDFFALKPFHDYSLCSVCILPGLRFTLSLQSAFSAFYPWSAVQVRSLRFTLTGLYQYTWMFENRVSKNINSFYYLGSTSMVP